MEVERWVEFKIEAWSLGLKLNGSSPIPTRPTSGTLNYGDTPALTHSYWISHYVSLIFITSGDFHTVTPTPVFPFFSIKST
jgi:hypothetical protein